MDKDSNLIVKDFVKHNLSDKNNLTFEQLMAIKENLCHLPNCESKDKLCEEVDKLEKERMV